uniref:Mucosaassociated lymphoid tissue lymphoma translocation protein 1like [Haplochromis burtoni] n=1 Tax=Lepeophtheirus salmonis TaxID=72036 RepID=A0A0K2U487_LEPSM
MMVFYYSSSRDGIPYNWPLWKIKREKSEEWNAVVQMISSVKYELLEKILKDDDVKAIVNGCPNFSKNFKEDQFSSSLINLFANRSQKTFGWLTTLCLNFFGAKSSTISFLSDLHEIYKPITILKDLSPDLISIPLGSSTTLEIDALGIPYVHYQWLFMPYDEEGNLKKWIRIDVDSQCKILDIFNIQLSDCGLYRCRIYHNIPVKTPDDKCAQDVLSSCVQIKVEVGSINIINQSSDVTSFLCGSAEFDITAESTHPLQYEWYFEDTKVFSQDDHNGKLKLANLRCEQSGRYKCKISNEFQAVESDVVKLVIDIPSLEDIQYNNITFENENIQILKQPSFNSSSRVNIGDKISLEIVASCKYYLNYEWCKRGLKQDLIDRNEPEERTDLILVCQGPQLVDIVTEAPKCTSYGFIGTWVYICLITCPRTNERIVSQSVNVPVSFCSSIPNSFPGFKIALIVCQEDYKTYDFHELQAPKYDGSVLMTALKEMDFKIFSFINLTTEEIRSAVELLCSFIDDTTYVLFYYNGHALGSGTNVYLTGINSSLSGSLKEFIWHGDLESKIDSCGPLLCVFLYDSCRDDPPKYFQEKLQNTKHPAISFKSSFVISYGTQPSMKSFECYEKSLGACQGLYMKYLLQHIRENIRVEEVFIKLSDSFMSGEDTSVVTKMRPEIKVSTRQAFYLCAPLRSNTCNTKQVLFFQMCRFESCVLSADVSSIFDNQFKYVIGLSYNKENKTFVWITGASNTNALNVLSYIVKITVRESNFTNEAILKLHINKTSPKIDNICKNFELQLSSPNVELISTTKNQNSHAPITVLFEPCRSKNVQRRDGPIFPLMDERDDILFDEIKLVNLQKVEGNAKLRLNLRTENDSVIVPIKGVLEIPLPILHNFPCLKLNSKSVLQCIK